MKPEIKEAIKLLTLYVVKEIDLRAMDFTMRINDLTIRVLTEDSGWRRLCFSFEILNELYYSGKLENYISSTVDEFKL